jgi:dTDP-4-dehydrorhamnose 3,5-epimerase
MTEWQETSIRGVWRGAVDPRADLRGSFAEVWRHSEGRSLGIAEVVQANVSRSDVNVVRGMHFHLRQTDVWALLEGQAVVALVDLRDRIEGGSAPVPVFAERMVAGDSLVIPEGVAHGFWALDRVTLLYLVTNEYDGTDELGFVWNDDEAGIPWPAGHEPVLSPRDEGAHPLSEAVEAAQRLRQMSPR